MQSQKQVWNSIAEEWNKFKKIPDPKVADFVAKAKGNLLDLGCGSGRNFTKTEAIIYGIDFSEKMIQLAGKKAKELKIKHYMIIQDIHSGKLPFEDNFIDKAICIATLHCIKGKTNRQKILKELHRIIKPKAQLLIKVWNKNNKKFKNKTKEKLINWQDKGARYYYFYEEKELLKELKQAKFNILNINSKDFEKQEIIILAEK